MIISVVAAKIWYLKNVRFLLGHPVQCRRSLGETTKLRVRRIQRKDDTLQHITTEVILTHKQRPQNNNNYPPFLKVL